MDALARLVAYLQYKLSFDTIMDEIKLKSSSLRVFNTDTLQYTTNIWHLL